MTPKGRTTRYRAARLLGLCPLLVAAGCATSKVPVAAVQPQPSAPPAISGTIAAIRPETSSPDPTGSLQQIMSILGQPAPQVTDASEIVVRMPDDTVKAKVQAPQSTLAVGSKAVITTGPAATIQSD